MSAGFTPLADKPAPGDHASPSVAGGLSDTAEAAPLRCWLIDNFGFDLIDWADDDLRF